MRVHTHTHKKSTAFTTQTIDSVWRLRGEHQVKRGGLRIEVRSPRRLRTEDIERKADERCERKVASVAMWPESIDSLASLVDRKIYALARGKKRRGARNKMITIAYCVCDGEKERASATQTKPRALHTQTSIIWKLECVRLSIRELRSSRTPNSGTPQSGRKNQPKQ